MRIAIANISRESSDRWVATVGRGCDVSHLIGGTIDQVKLMLVDQHGLQIDSLLGEKFSCVLVIESE